MYGGVSPSLYQHIIDIQQMFVKLKTIHTHTYMYVSMYILYVFIYGYIQ